MPPPTEQPIGVLLARTAKVVNRAFDDALAEVGGTAPTWLVLIAAKSRGAVSQRELAEAVGIRGATLTHHLDAMAAAGLVTRERDPDNRRVQRVRLTPDGEVAFAAMRTAAVAFDRRLRNGLAADDLAALRRALGVLEGNVRQD